MSNSRKYTRNRTFQGYGTYAKTSPTPDYVAIPKAGDLRAAEIYSLRKRIKAAAAMKTGRGAYIVRLLTAELERLGGKI